MLDYSVEALSKLVVSGATKDMLELSHMELLGFFFLSSLASLQTISLPNAS